MRIPNKSVVPSHNSVVFCSSSTFLPPSRLANGSWFRLVPCNFLATRPQSSRRTQKVLHCQKPLCGCQAISSLIATWTWFLTSRTTTSTTIVMALSISSSLGFNFSLHFSYFLSSNAHFDALYIFFIDLLNIFIINGTGLTIKGTQINCKGLLKLFTKSVFKNAIYLLLNLENLLFKI